MLVAVLSKPCVITVGNFDGVHLGHRALIDRCRQLAEGIGGHVAVLTFTHHPLTVLHPDRTPPRLMDTSQRMAALLEAGAERIEWLEPTEKLLHLSSHQFVQRAVELYKPVAWVEGPDFRFGHQRSGDTQVLRDLGRQFGFELHVVDPVEVVLRDKARCAVNSSLIRWLLGQGRVSDAAICLGRPYVVRGKVVRGENRGHQIGFPTVNLDVEGRQLPGDGVYGGRVELDGQTLLAAISVGTKPTFGPHERTFEAFLLDYNQDLYGRTLDVRVLRWLRDQWVFPSVQSLVRQMEEDVAGLTDLHRRQLLDPRETVASP